MNYKTGTKTGISSMPNPAEVSAYVFSTRYLLQAAVNTDLDGKTQSGSKAEKWNWIWLKIMTIYNFCIVDLSKIRSRA